MVFRRLTAAIFAVAIGFAALPSWASAPSEVIRSFNAALLDVMRNADTLGFDGRYRKLDPAVRSTFDLEFMMHYAVTRHWEALTPAQREQLVDSFGRMTVATYANRFDDYTGEKFEVLEEVPQRQGMTLVKSQIIDSEGKPVALNYLMRETPQGWRVVDVFFKGSISELATRRSEYSSVIQRDGYEALNSRLAALAANETKPR